jgi:pimeloyl-ACP methyl ester carboxylesterase
MTIDFALAERLIEVANDAYYASSVATAPQNSIATTFARLDGSVRQYFDLEDWLTRNNYRRIVDPDATDPNQRYFGLVALTPDGVVVAFRGTATLPDIAVDLAFPMYNWPLVGQKLPVHSGFLNQYLRLRESAFAELRAALNEWPGAPVYMTGHSLGAALATLCAAELPWAIPKVRARLWTFASPKVGGSLFATFVSVSAYDSYRIYNKYDQVPNVPIFSPDPALPEPPAPEPAVVGASYYQHVPADVVEVNVGPWYTPLANHLLTSYYRGLQEVKAVHGSSLLDPSTSISSLEVVVRTSEIIESGADDSAHLRLLDVDWGPLTGSGAGFAAGSQHRYDLFARWPDRKPAVAKVGDLTNLGVTVYDGPFDDYDPAGWRPESITIVVNGVDFCTVDLHAHNLSWATDRSLEVSLVPAP